MFCTSKGFKSPVLRDRGLTEDHLKVAQFITHSEDLNLTDIEKLWDNATYSADEFVVSWTVLEGNSSWN